MAQAANIGANFEFISGQTNVSSSDIIINNFYDYKVIKNIVINYVGQSHIGTG